MIRTRRVWALFAAIASFAVFQAQLTAQTVDIEAAKKEGTLVFYGAVPPQSMNIITKPFEQKYGIKVEYWRASVSKILDRTLNEARAGRPNFDVVETTRGAHLILKSEGLFSKFVPPSSETFPDNFKEKDGLMTPWRVTPLSILYNTELVKGADIPKSFQDLLDPKWKKKITMPDPSQNTTIVELLRNMEKLVGSKWLDYVKALAKQEPHFVEALSPVTNVVIRGEASVGISYVKYVKQYKGPVDYVMLDKFLGIVNYMSVSVKAAHPNAGRLFIEYIMSPEGQKALASQAEFGLAPGVYPDIRNAEKVLGRTVIMDTPTEQELKTLTNDFRKIFLEK